MRVLSSVTIACSSLLLFLIQPIMAKTLLPAFGGTAGVWVTCMLFFQVMLLAGYCYSWVVTSYLGQKAQCAVHAIMLLASLATISAHPRLAAAQSANGNPAAAILLVLLASVGLPYFLLATTSPLLQTWFAQSTQTGNHAARLNFPWWLFALSNAASLAALLTYPIAIEPWLPQSTQLRVWWFGYAAVAVLGCAVCGLHARTRAIAVATEEARDGAERSERPLVWIALAACASALWMAVANHLSQEVAPVPFLWVLPLSVYLLSFILCFEGEGWYRPAVFRWLLPVAWCAAAWRMASPGTSGLVTEVAIFSLALFIWCMFCHGEIASMKPRAASRVTFFYLMLAVGGASGALLVGLVAPNLLNTYLELPIGIAGSVILALYLLYGLKSPARLIRLAVVAVAAFAIATRFEAGFSNVTHLRNFYGALQIRDEVTSGDLIRTLYNGRTLHGVEFLTADKTRLATAYYGPNSGVGRVMLLSQGKPRTVGLVGLGVGTLASYGRAGDLFRFYEINPAVIQVATRDFRFLGSSEAKIEIIEADGRLALEKESPATFDILVLDAFADDSIPVHLLTREAFATYFHLLRPAGILAVHVTNRYLELAPVVEAGAAASGAEVVEVHSAADPVQQVKAADWALVSQSPERLRELGPLSSAPTKARLWTDDYSNLFQVLK